MAWAVKLSNKAAKQARKLPNNVQDNLKLLLKEIISAGPVRGNWKNYGKLADNKHHCHIKSGKPTYVAVWEEMNNSIKLVEVIYAGTHEKAPY
jgi:mRNA-degrading endonuclease RelE of RelBE toxin-antitoxin system